jgi:predicted PurR-regulated permease PerM
MPRWLPRAMLLALALVGAYQLASWAFHQLLGLLVLLLVSFFLSLAVEPAVQRLADLGMRRGVATFLVFLVLFLAAAGFTTALGSLLVDQLIDIAERFPGYVRSLIDWVNETFHLNLTLDQVQSGILKDSGSLQAYAQTAANNAWGLSSSVIGGLFDLLTVLLFTFYLAADGPRMRRAVCSVLPPERQATVLQAWEIALTKTGGYLYSRVILALISATAHYVLLLLLDVPYAPFLAIWIGLVSQFVPTVGTYLAILLPALIGFAHRPIDAVWILAFATAYQQIENYLLQPRVTARTVDIHPAVAFGSVIAGVALLGPVGALIAIPATATLQGFMAAYIKHYEVTDPRALGPHLRTHDPDRPRRRFLRRRPEQEPPPGGEAEGPPSEGPPPDGGSA